MVIRNNITNKTATRSPLNNRGCAVPPDSCAHCKTTLKGSPHQPVVLEDSDTPNDRFEFKGQQDKKS